MARASTGDPQLAQFLQAFKDGAAAARHEKNGRVFVTVRFGNSGTARDFELTPEGAATIAELSPPLPADLSPQAAAHELNVSRTFVLKEIQAGRLQAYKKGGHHQIPRAALEAYAAVKRAKQAQAMAELSRIHQELGLD